MSPRNERIARHASLTLVVIAVAGVFAYTATLDGRAPLNEGATSVAVGGGSQGDGTGSTGGTSTSTSPAGGDGGRTAGGEGGGTTTTATPTTTSTTTTTTVAAAPDLGLSPADMAQPPQEPVGIYRQGQIILGGSVPSEEVAADYVRRTAAILGPENIIMHMALDPRVSGETLRIDVDEQFQYDTGSSDFDPRFTSLLELWTVGLRLLPEATLVITGHTDATGDPTTNVALSRARAQVVVEFMVQHGLPADRVVSRGVGSSEPVATNDTPEGRRANRRIQASVEGITRG